MLERRLTVTAVEQASGDVPEQTCGTGRSGRLRRVGRGCGVRQAMFAAGVTARTAAPFR
jgi:hypothetical protein